MRCPRTCFLDQPPGNAARMVSDSGSCRSPGSAASTRHRSWSLISLICLAEVYQSRGGWDSMRKRVNGSNRAVGFEVKLGHLDVAQVVLV